MEKQVGRSALMSIKPQFAHAIMAGTKKVELRHKAMADDISRAIVYSTKPDGLILGAFEVGGYVTDTPSKIWRKFGSVSGITKGHFFSYFDGRESATAILVGAIYLPKSPISLQRSLGLERGPQSFQYLDETVALELLRDWKRA
jgi:predicted transcriptional regulator